MSFAAALTLGAVNVAAQTMNAPAGTLAKTDQNFLNEAIEGDLAEINIGKLAQQKGQSQDVKQFGQMLEQDHSQHLQKATQTAQQNGVHAPINWANCRERNSTGNSRMIWLAITKKDIGKYEKEAKSKGPLADFAQQTVPALQKHLQTAESLTGQERSQR